MELEYLDEIKLDVNSLMKSSAKFIDDFTTCVNRVIEENDLYMSDEKPIERDCHYIAIGAYAIETNNINNLDIAIINEIKRSLDIIKSNQEYTMTRLEKKIKNI